MGLFNKKKTTINPFVENGCCQNLINALNFLMQNKVPSKATKAAIQEICECIKLSGCQIPGEVYAMLKERDLYHDSTIQQ